METSKMKRYDGNLSQHIWKSTCPSPPQLSTRHNRPPRMREYSSYVMQLYIYIYVYMWYVMLYDVCYIVCCIYCIIYIYMYVCMYVCMYVYIYMYMYDLLSYCCIMPYMKERKREWAQKRSEIIYIYNYIYRHMKYNSSFIMTVFVSDLIRVANWGQPPRGQSADANLLLWWLREHHQCFGGLPELGNRKENRGRKTWFIHDLLLGVNRIYEKLQIYPTIDEK